MTHNPAIPFEEIQVPGADRALAIINNLSPNQARYALWAALVLLFGNPDCNASEILAFTGPPINLRLKEAVLLLAQISIKRSYPDRLEIIEESVKMQLAEEARNQ